MAEKKLDLPEPLAPTGGTSVMVPWRCVGERTHYVDLRAKVLWRGLVLVGLEALDGYLCC